MKTATLARVFNEWARRYSLSPESFGDVLDESGHVVSDYGHSCAIYFKRIEKDLNIVKKHNIKLP